MDLPAIVRSQRRGQRRRQGAHIYIIYILDIYTHIYIYIYVENDDVLIHFKNVRVEFVVATRNYMEEPYGGCFESVWYIEGIF